MRYLKNFFVTDYNLNVPYRNKDGPSVLFIVVFLFSLMFLMGCSENDPVGPNLDTTAPKVEWFVPQDGQNNVPETAYIAIKFDESIVADDDDFSLLCADNQIVSGQIVVQNDSLFFYPTQPLDCQVTFTAVIKSTVTDKAGNKLGSDIVWNFVTVKGAQPDTTHPYVMSNIPVDGANEVVANTSIVFRLSESILTSTLTDATCLVKENGNTVSRTASFTNLDLTIYPTTDFALGSTVEVILTDGITDSAGNQLVFTTISFTITVGDTVRPFVSSISPQNGATGFGINDPIVIDLSEVLNSSLVNSSNVYVKDDSDQVVSTTIDYSQTTLRLIPDNPWSYLTTYTIHLSDTLEDLAGNLFVPFISTFTIEDKPFTPYVIDGKYRVQKIESNVNGYKAIAGEFGSTGAYDAFFGLLNPNGKLLWLNEITSSDIDQALGLYIDENHVFFLWTEDPDGFGLGVNYLQKRTLTNDSLFQEEIFSGDMGASMHANQDYIFIGNRTDLFQISYTDGSIENTFYTGCPIEGIYVSGSYVYISGVKYNGNTGTNDFYVSSLDFNLTEQWFEIYDSDLLDFNGRVTVSGGYVYIAGMSHNMFLPTNPIPRRITLLKYDLDGNFIWHNEDHNITNCSGVISDQNGNLFIANGIDKINSTGSVVWTNHSPGHGLTLHNSTLFQANSSNQILLFNANSGASL